MKVNHAWFRGGWFDPLTIAWKDIATGARYERPPVTEGGPSPGATRFVPFTLAPGASKTLVLRLAWYVGQTSLRVGRDPQPPAAGQGVPGQAVDLPDPNEKTNPEPHGFRLHWPIPWKKRPLPARSI